MPHDVNEVRRVLGGPEPTTVVCYGCTDCTEKELTLRRLYGERDELTRRVAELARERDAGREQRNQAQRDAESERATREAVEGLLHAAQAEASKSLELLLEMTDALEAARAETRRFYRADGSFEVLASAEEVRKRRVLAAVELLALQARVVELEKEALRVA